MSHNANQKALQLTGRVQDARWPEKRSAPSRLPYPPDSYQPSERAQGGGGQNGPKRKLSQVLAELRAQRRVARLGPEARPPGTEVYTTLLTFSGGFPSGFDGPSFGDIEPKDSRGGEGGSGVSSSPHFQLASTGDFC